MPDYYASSIADSVGDGKSNLIGRQFAVFVFINLPTNDLAAENTHEQIPVEKRAFEEAGQIGDISTRQLFGCRRVDGFGLV
ncbi:MAG: hypothetical protein KGZ88_10400 [Methylomicrobium sp.]|nr:hypothetical protein [Methylomicrobium sp.]